MNNSKVQKWALLFTKITKVKEILTSNYFDDDYLNWSICDYQIEFIDKRQLLVISSCMGENVKITFFSETTFLALDRDRHLLNI